jgi:hypothetical protein
MLPVRYLLLLLTVECLVEHLGSISYDSRIQIRYMKKLYSMRICSMMMKSGVHTIALRMP